MIQRLLQSPKILNGVLVLALAQSALAQHAYELSGDFWGTHDPSIIRQKDTWYVFATGKARDGGQIGIRCSHDLKTWTLCGHVFEQIPQWIQEKSPETRDLWAPDISLVDGQYRLYYAYSLFGKNLSGIGLATNTTLDRTDPAYHWADQGLVVQSTAADNYNAIDPNLIVDAEDRAWLNFGSFWGGIKMRRLDNSGKASTEDTTIYSLATRRKPGNPAAAKPGLPPNWQAVEAPFLFRHCSFYYLFVSWDLCCKGAKSTYRTMVGRAKIITGPYLDANGKSMQDGGGTEILGGNAAWAGPGGESALSGAPDDLLVFHAYDSATGMPALQISTIGLVDRMAACCFRFAAWSRA